MAGAAELYSATRTGVGRTSEVNTTVLDGFAPRFARMWALMIGNHDLSPPQEVCGPGSPDFLQPAACSLRRRGRPVGVRRNNASANRRHPRSARIVRSALRQPASAAAIFKNRPMAVSTGLRMLVSKALTVAWRTSRDSKGVFTWSWPGAATTVIRQTRRTPRSKPIPRRAELGRASRCRGRERTPWPRIDPSIPLACPGSRDAARALSPIDGEF